MFRRLIPALLLAGMMYSPAAMKAATWNSLVLNGSACYAYPSSSGAFSYEHIFYGYKGTAHCNLQFNDDWSVNNLSYILFNGNTGGSAVKVRACVHSGSGAVTCGSQISVSSTFVNYVYPPAFPAYAIGAYLEFDFPNDGWTTIYDVIAAFYKP